MAKTALDLTTEELKSYNPIRKHDHWQTQERQEKAWEVAHKAAKILREKFGATRVIVFGSLIYPDWFSPWSDIDISAWGIPVDQFYRAVAVVAGVSQDFEINLLAPESCRKSLKQVIESEGIEI